MEEKLHGSRIFSLLILLFFLAWSGNTARALKLNHNPSPATSAPTATPTPLPAIEKPIVARVYFSSREDLDVLAARLDVWEVHPAERYLVTHLTPGEYQSLLEEGFRVEIDPGKTGLLALPRKLAPGQVSGIPGYPCYRTVEETYQAMANLAALHPSLAERIDIGDSWDKITPGGPSGYDLYALQLTNRSNSGPKPEFFLMAEIHAREYTTAETALRFAEYLLQQYGTDPDATWLLDQYQIDIVPMTNPDGRKFAETGEFWRKNTNNHNGYTIFPYYGTDLNRNSTFHWGGASSNPGSETYQGPSPGSEPETQAIQAYVQSLFPGRSRAGEDIPTPADTSGLFLSLHSYSELVLWPYGFRSDPAPDSTPLTTLGRRLAFFNGYTPEQSYSLYSVTGSTEDWAYGTLGVPAYTFEMGTDFFESCSTFESTTYPDNLKAILYAAKAARRPYLEPAGPEAISLSLMPAGAGSGSSFQLTATIDDTRFNNFNGTEPTQNIAAASYTIDTPAWVTSTTAIAVPMTPIDGSFDQKIEAVQANINPQELAPGRHLVYVRGQDASGAWGVPSAIFLYVSAPNEPPDAAFSSDSPVELGSAMHFTNQSTGAPPLSYLWDFGDGSVRGSWKDPAYTYLSPGDYTVTLTTTNTLGSSTIAHPVSVKASQCYNVTGMTLSHPWTGVIHQGDAVSFRLEVVPAWAIKPYSYTVNFGDGTPAVTGSSSLVSQPLTHTYNITGTLTLPAAAWNCSMDPNAPAQAQLQIQISPPGTLNNTFFTFIMRKK